jgi:uncharacterized membrane protein
MKNGQNGPGMSAGVLRGFTVVAVVTLVLSAILTIWAAFDSDTSMLGLVLQVAMTVLVGFLTWTVLRTWRRQRKIENPHEDE